MNNSIDFISENNATKWSDYVTEFVSFLRSSFFTYADFSDILDKVITHPNSKITGLKFSIKTHEKNLSLFEYKKLTEDRDTDNLNTQDLDNHNWFYNEYSIWYRKNIQKDGTDKDDVTRLIRLLIDAFWKSSSRDEKTRTWAKLIPGTSQLINSTLSYYKNRCHYITILYCDLDKFHELNRAHGDSVGDSVLLQMTDLFTKFVIDKPAILLHDKGDEFIILIFSAFIEEGLAVAYDFQNTLKTNSFEITTTNGKEILESEITVGINIRYTKTNHDISFSSEIQLAEQVAKDAAGNKRYKIANLHNAEEQKLEIQQLSEFTANASKLNLKVSPLKRVFRNIWLNFISEQAETVIRRDGTLDAMYDILEWIKPEFSQKCSSFHEYTNFPDFTKDFSVFDILIALTRGIISCDSTTREKHFYSIKKDKKLICLYSDSNKIFELPGTIFKALEIGTFFKNEILPVALLVKIGHGKILVPENIFGDIIIVDDRPSRGGGLPDFWELALAKVVNQINTDPNLKYVYIIGDVKYGINTVNWLERIANGDIQNDIETIIYKIQTTNQAINNTVNRLKDAVKSYDTIKEIVKAYAEFVTNGQAFVTQGKESNRQRPPAFLQKDVRIDDYGLVMEDGFKVRTLSEAYPLMLEIARISTNKNNSIRDQARGYLGELIDFKVELSDPTKDLIPFYYRADEEKFEDYFNKLFIEDEGLFAKALNGQLEPVLKHIEESITTERKQYSTRRAILIIPNRISKKEGLIPLGLVSLRIIPRLKSPKSVGLVFSYTWRTVEALVGFPYSLYGSIRYGEYIKQLLQKRVENQGLKITFDKVSYIANSLHIFMDEHGQDIAKSIINDASI